MDTYLLCHGTSGGLESPHPLAHIPLAGGYVLRIVIQQCDNGGDITVQDDHTNHGGLRVHTRLADTTCQ